ncbi:hypothetical protein H0H92_009307, partial [Tricholoma furcatifolium]
PVTRAQAISLDHAISEKVHSLLGFPFRFPTALLTLPVASRGLGFPSISAINDACAVNGIIRDLNHPSTTFRHPALVTLADWTCQLNKCSFPLTTPGIVQTPGRLGAHIPHAWVLAQDVLRDLDISIRDTDLSGILHEEVNIQHLYNITQVLLSPNLTPLSNPPNPTSPSNPHISPATLTTSRTDLIPLNTFKNLTNHNFKNIEHIGHWTYNHSSPIPSFTLHPIPPGAPRVIKRDWPLLETWTSQLPQALSVLTRGDPSLLLSRRERQSNAEMMVIHAERLTNTKLDVAGPPHTFATDASQVFNNRHPCVTSAVVTPQKGLVFSLRLFRNSATIQRGEAFAMVAAHILALSNANSSNLTERTMIYSDHLSSVNIAGKTSVPPYTMF